MDRSRLHFAWAIASALVTLTAGSPAVADDVELLLSTPGGSAKPNILFILDSSGSMNTVETTQEPFDATKSYTVGPCDQNLYYWSTNSSVPNCGGEREVKKSFFVCDQGITQIKAAGSYTDTMGMYRKKKGKWKWRTLDKKKDDEYVECKQDSSVHGYGATPGNEPYAQSGNNNPLYTTDSNLVVDWGSKPTHKIYTVYDGNYLNWYYNPPGTAMSRTAMMKAVTKNVLGSVSNVNVGFMRFNNTQGGRVLHALKDLDSNRAQANTVVDNIPAGGWTPLAETMYEAGLYYSGLNTEYATPAITDPDAILANPPMNYKAPAEFACSKNFIVLLTDGAPTEDVDAWNKVGTLPNYPTVMGRAGCDGTNVNGACMDDVSEYLSKADINPAVPDQQSVTTFTIGFSVDLPILKETAEVSGGSYHLATDVQSLTKALLDILTNIFDRDISFTAPAVAVNAFNRTQHLNDLYVSVFRAQDEVHWPGNVKKFTITDREVRDSVDKPAVDPGTGFFDEDAINFWSLETVGDGTDVHRGGAANVLPLPGSRKVYTNKVMGSLTLPVNSFSLANLPSFPDADLGLTGAAGEPPIADLIEWARGVDIKDEDNDPATLARYAMGDTLHSQPAAVVYGNGGGTQDIVVFNATNDGYLHAINADTGIELWSFLPYELLDNLTDLYFNENVDYKTYGLDGSVVPVVYDKDQDGIIEPIDNDFVYLVFGMRRGGDNYYMLDVTDRNSPALRWIKTFPETGQSWSTPSVARIDITGGTQTSAQKAVLVMGGGYDTAHDSPGHPASPDLEGAGIYMLDLDTGDQLWRAGTDGFANLIAPDMTRAVPSTIRVIDMNSDGFANRMYAADLGGQLWRFDIANGSDPNSLVAGGVIAQLGAEGLPGVPTAAETRRFYTTPDVALFTDHDQNRRYLSVSIGSGYRAHPLDNSAADRFYSIRDADVFAPLTQGQYNTYTVVKDADLIDVAGQVGTIIPANGRGWKFVLPANQKILSTSSTFNDSVFFVTFEPTVNTSDPCQAGIALNRLYKVSVANGDPVVAPGEPMPPAADSDEARVSLLEQGGIAPSPVFLFPTSTNASCTGEECSPPPIACIGVECFDPDFQNSPVRTLWTQDGVD